MGLACTCMLYANSSMSPEQCVPHCMQLPTHTLRNGHIPSIIHSGVHSSHGYVLVCVCVCACVSVCVRV